MNEPAAREIMSPEGVEECLRQETTFRITLTGGGKHRVYVEDQGKISSVEVVESFEEARKMLGTLMALYAGMTLDPRRTIASIMRKMDEAPRA